jgi:hypothetical protein
LELCFDLIFLLRFFIQGKNEGGVIGRASPNGLAHPAVSGASLRSPVLAGVAKHIQGSGCALLFLFFKISEQAQILTTKKGRF